MLDLISVEQNGISGNLPLKHFHLRVSEFDQANKFPNHSRAFSSKGCESLVLICEISRGSGVTGKLGVAGGRSADVVLQACNAASISSEGSLQALQVLSVVMGVFLLGASVLEQCAGFLFGLGLARLGLACDMSGQCLLRLSFGHLGAG